MESSTKRYYRGDEFTAVEMEVAEILIHILGYRDPLFPPWGSKRKRSTNSTLHANNAHKFNVMPKYRTSPTTPLNLSWSEPEDFEEDLPLHSTRLLSSPNLNSKNERVRKTPRRRAPKKKTHMELKEMVNALSLEREKMKKDKEQLLKTFQELRDQNEHLKSQLALCVDRQEGKMPPTSQPTSFNPVSPQETETSVSLDLSWRLDERNCSETFCGTSPLVSAFDDPQSVGTSTRPYSPSSSGSEKGNSLRPTEDLFCCLGIPDLNTPSEALSDAVPDSFDGQIHLPMNKAAVAAEARKRRIELTRVKYAHSRKARSR